MSELADPSLSTKKKTRGKYVVYSGKDRALIGIYALENGNERERLHFSSRYPELKESTIRNFKKAYRERMEHERKQQHPKPVTEISAKSRGRPPILQELDVKLISSSEVFVVKVAWSTGMLFEKQLLLLLLSISQHLLNFYMPRAWIQSIYHRMGYTKRMGTTTRPPIPSGLYKECRMEYQGQNREI